MRKKDLTKKQKNLLIGFLLAIVLVMAVGYAAFSTQLNISNTASIDSTWNVRITGIQGSNTCAPDSNSAYRCETDDYAAIVLADGTITVLDSDYECQAGFVDYCEVAK